MDNQKLLEQLQSLVTEYPTHYGKMIKGKKYPELLAYVECFPGRDLKEKIFITLNGEVEHACRACGKETEFISSVKGYRTFCDVNCQQTITDAKANEEKAALKLNTFGDVEYISGYQGSHSQVKVRNKNCGCFFEATYLNLFTNKDYCPIHGVALRTKYLTTLMKDGLSIDSKAKRKATFEAIRVVKSNEVKRINASFEDDLITAGREAIIEYLNEISRTWKSTTWRRLDRLPRIKDRLEMQFGYRFGQKIYNYCNYIDFPSQTPKCIDCGKFVNYQAYSNRYNAFCSVKCAADSDITRTKTKSTQYKKYGGWHHSTKETQDKKRATCFVKYGVSNVLQSKEIQKQVFKSQYRLKPTTLPSGRVIDLMGYEPQVLEYLLTKELYSETDFDFDDIPTFKYGIHQLYFPDFYIPFENLIIEVKSNWTHKMDEAKNIKKKEAVEAAGYKYRLIIWDGSLNK